jgi:AcrR family transcriptional regulator
MRPGDDEDLTARANVRNAALRLFAEHGHDAVSVRKVAAEAGVSPALVSHHFGSKAGLREAVDLYVAKRIDAFMAEGGDDVARLFAEGDGGSIAEVFTRVFPPDSPLPAYVRRLLLSGDPAGVRLFGKWFEGAQHILDQMVHAGLAKPSRDPDVRAAFSVAADVALLVLREPLTAVLGFDPLSPEGLTRWTEEATAICREGMFVQPTAEAESPDRASEEATRREGE